MPNWTIPTTYGEVWGFAQNLGVPKEAVVEWINNNGAYPNNLDTFVSYMSQKGYRNPDGTYNWHWWEINHNTPSLAPNFLRPGAGTNPLGESPTLPGGTPIPATTPVAAPRTTPTPGATPSPGSGNALPATFAQAKAYVQAHPYQSAGIAAFVAYMLKGKRR